MENLCTIEEVMDLLHIKSKTTIYKKITSGLLPGFRPAGSRRWLFKKDDIYALLQDAQDTVDPTEQVTFGPRADR